MKPTVYLHVGPPKTASTYLQKKCLRKLNNKNVVVRPKVMLGKKTIYFHRLFSMSSAIWAEEGAKILQDLSMKSVANGKDLVISSEGMYGGFAIPRPWNEKRSKKLTSRLNGIWSTSGNPYPSLFAEHLKEVEKKSKELGFGRVKVLFNLRRQDQKIPSGYAEMSSSIKGASQKHFEEWAKFIIKDPIGYYGLGGVKLNYYELWHEVSKKIGEEKLLMLPVELSRENEKEFLKRWAKFMNIKEAEVMSTSEGKSRVSSEKKDTWKLRPPERTVRTLPFRIAKKAGIAETYGIRSLLSRGTHIKLKTGLKNLIKKKYKDPNKKIDNRIDNIDLSEYGYY